MNFTVSFSILFFSSDCFSEANVDKLKVGVPISECRKLRLNKIKPTPKIVIAAAFFTFLYLIKMQMYKKIMICNFGALKT